jgi:hypothetical protein
MSEQERGDKSSAAENVGLALPLAAHDAGGFGWIVADANKRVLGYCLTEKQAHQLADAANGASLSARERPVQALVDWFTLSVEDFDRKHPDKKEWNRDTLVEWVAARELTTPGAPLSHGGKPFSYDPQGKWEAPPYGMCPQCGINRYQPMPECALEGCPTINAAPQGNRDSRSSEQSTGYIKPEAEGVAPLREQQRNGNVTPAVAAPLPSTEKPLNEDRDAARWAREFIASARGNRFDPLEEGWLISWFANAMMCGEDTYRWRKEAESRSSIREPVGWMYEGIARHVNGKRIIRTEEECPRNLYPDTWREIGPVFAAPRQCPYCASDNPAIRGTYYDQTCEGCVKRMGAKDGGAHG